MQLDILETPALEKITSFLPSGGYAEILKSLDLQYKQTEYYLQVGEFPKTHGWVLHISVVLSQVGNLMQIVIPFLAIEKVTFKIVLNESVSEDILSGNLGIAQIGKIVCIYPENNSAALILAKKLIELTRLYKGPAVPTDICLGSVIYTRYESFKPIIKTDENGKVEKYFYNDKGQLIKDRYVIPFSMPAGIEWPFKELADPIDGDSPTLFNRLYRVVDILKNDPRGNVFKGLYLKNLFQVKTCVLKQGFSNSNSDKFGRDIQDRLIWQYELYKKLSDTVPMPKVYDLIQEPGYTLLALEFIKGVSLYQKVHDINPLSQCWRNIPIRESLALIDYGIQLSLVLDKMHRKGYVHRDIIPVNFLIDTNNRIILIDMELTYSLLDQQPSPPFTLGTPGFMSPEQEATQQPTIAQDIYSLGATLLHLFTGLTPVKFNTRNTFELISKLEFFIGNNEMAEIIAKCLHYEPNSRPSISTVLAGLSAFAHQTQTISNRILTHSAKNLDHNELIALILAAANGLTKPPVVSFNDLWYSKQITLENSSAPINKEYTKYPGLGEGMAGAMYVLARLKKMGINVTSCEDRYKKGWQFIEENYLTSISELSPGLYNGAAGLALALAEGIHSGMLENNWSNREKLKSCLELNNKELNLATGISGQGVSFMQCSDLLTLEHSQASLKKIVDHLLNVQGTDGFWMRPLANHHSKNGRVYDFGLDDTGILWFLLDYISVYTSVEIQGVLENALSKILNNKRLIRDIFEHIASKKSYEQGDGRKGFILLFIKAYETLHDNKYKKFAENALSKYPHCIVHSNFTQQNGLAGIGEVYLEAWRVFKEEEWKSRADWIASVFMNTLFSRKDGSGYWLLEERNNPTADLLIGISGILHFLARCIDPDKTGFRLLK